MSKYSRMMGPTRSREMPSCSAIDLAEIRPGGLPRLAREFDQYLRSGHCFGSSRKRRFTGGKTTTFKMGHQVFDGGI